jgi:hypothetical protein
MKISKIKDEKTAIEVLKGSPIVLDMKKHIQYWTFGVVPSDKQIAAGRVLDCIVEDKTSLSADGKVSVNATRKWSTVWVHNNACFCKACTKGESFKIIVSQSPSGKTYKLLQGKKFNGVIRKTLVTSSV